MIIPRYWAEAREQHREKGRQVTVRRFGWSSTSPDDAEALATARAREAMIRILAGEALESRERKVPYNGADGVPIREEIVEEHGDTIITRNSYGARCLNTPNVLFADVDFEPNESWSPVGLLGLVPFGIAAWLGVTGRSWWLIALILLAGVILVITISLRAQRRGSDFREGMIIAARNRISAFVESHPRWNGRVYRTPNGFRLLVLHKLFHPGDREVHEFFDALKADPTYVRMCQRQNCFRARVSPKPWRMGVAQKLGPRPVVWPPRPEAMPFRQKWIANYELRA